MSMLKGRWALVTGASSGLGTDFARVLAEEGAHLVLVARREDRLRQLAGELEHSRGVRTLVLPADLGAKDAPRELYDRLAERGIAVDVLVNNAGFGVYGNFTEIPWDRERQMLELDILALVHLTKLFAQDMVKRDFGRILQVASIGAYQPSPTYATYSAAKAFVLSFSEALSYELRHTHVKVTVVSPGVTATEFLQVSGQTPTFYQRLAMMTSDKVARVGVRAMLKGKTSAIPGLVNSLPTFSLRFMPRRAQAAVASRLMRSN